MYNVKLSENVPYEFSFSLPAKLLNHWKRGQEPEPTYLFGSFQPWCTVAEQNSSSFSQSFTGMWSVWSFLLYSSKLKRRNQKCWRPHLTSSLMPEHIHQHFLCKTYPDSAEDTLSPQLIWVGMLAWVGEVWKALALGWIPHTVWTCHVSLLCLSFHRDKLSKLIITIFIDSKWLLQAS